MKLEVDAINGKKSRANQHCAYPATQLLSCFLARLLGASGCIRLKLHFFLPPQLVYHHLAK